MTTTELAALIEQPKTVTFWGDPYTITPAFVRDPLGDGRQLIFIEPLATRPNYYVLRVDSSWCLDSTTRRGLVEPCDWLDWAEEAIAAEYDWEGSPWFQLSEDDPDYEELEWPVLITSLGVSWGRYRWPSEWRRVA